MMITFCSCSCAFTTLTSDDGGFWLAVSSSISQTQVSSESRFGRNVSVSVDSSLRVKADLVPWIQYIERRGENQEQWMDR